MKPSAAPAKRRNRDLDPCVGVGRIGGPQRPRETPRKPVVPSRPSNHRRRIFGSHRHHGIGAPPDAAIDPRARDGLGLALGGGHLPATLHGEGIERTPRGDPPDESDAAGRRDVAVQRRSEIEAKEFGAPHLRDPHVKGRRRADRPDFRREVVGDELTVHHDIRLERTQRRVDLRPGRRRHAATARRKGEISEEFH